MASPDEPVRPAYTLTPLGGLVPTRLTPPAGSLPGLLVESPTCYESPVQTLICLGWVNNPDQLYAQNIQIAVYLLNPADGVPLEISLTSPPVDVLLPQSGSPYRAIFHDVPPDWSPYAELYDVHYLATAPASIAGYQQTWLQDLATEWEGNAYHIIGRIVAAEEVFRYDSLHLVISIWDEDGAITGFRVLDIPVTEEIYAEGLFFEHTIAPLDGQPGTLDIFLDVSTHD
jgi:hypothetical protein